MTNSYKIRKFKKEDLGQVVSLIDDHDEDDAKDAKNTLLNSNNLVAINENGIILGVSGYEYVNGTDYTAYLSWTYVLKSKLREGIGSKLLNHALESAKKDGCRLIVLKISDYTESGSDTSIYDGARQLYLKKGFKVQIYCPNFYDEGEGVEIMTLRLDGSKPSRPNIKDEKPMLRFSRLKEIIETNGAYSFDWIVKNSFLTMKNRSFSVKDLEVGIDAAKKSGARVIFLTFPSNLPLIHEPLQQAGFKLLGRVEDYYEDGVNELHFIKTLDL